MSQALTMANGKRPRQPVNTTPTTRLCIKNIDERMTEDKLHDTLMNETGKGSKKLKQIKIDITDLKILRNQQGKSRRIALVGVKTIEQATAIQIYWHRAYIGKSIVTVEYHTPNAQKWSKYSEGSLTHEDTIKQKEDASQYRQEKAAQLLLGKKLTGKKSFSEAKQEQEILSLASMSDDEEKKRKILDALRYHPALLGLSDDEKLRVVKNPVFHDYISSSLERASKNGKLWDNDDNSGKTNLLRAVYHVLNGNVGQSSSTEPKEQIQVRGEGITMKDDQADAPSSGNDTVDELKATVSTYEELMKSLKQKQADGQLGNDDDDDSDDYFDNPGILGAKDDDDDDDGDENSDNDDNQTKKAALSDSDFLKMAMQGFSSDEEEELGDMDEDDEDEDENDDEDDQSNDDEVPASKKQRVDDSTDPKSSEANPDEHSADNEQDSLVSLTDGELTDEQRVLKNSSLFIRNLPYTTTEDDIIELCSDYGQLAGVDFAVDLNNQSKGYCTVYFQIGEQAVKAYHGLSRSIFQGRTLHVIPGKTSTSSRTTLLDKLGDDDLKNMTYKRKQELEKQVNAMSTTHNWNSLFISSDTVANAVAAKFNLKKSELLTSDDAYTEQHSGAVRLAVAETHIIAETKAFLEEYGVILDKFTSSPHDRLKGKRISTEDKLSKQIILVKNIPFDTEEKELRKVFSRYGNLGRVILPPYKTMAIIEYLSVVNARNAFQNLAYKRFKSSPLYLEWAPADCLKSAEETGFKGALVSVDDDSKKKAEKAVSADKTKSTMGGDGDHDDEDGIDANLVVPTVFVKNLNFETTDDQLKVKIQSMIKDVQSFYQSTAPPSQSKTSNISDSTLWNVRYCVIMKRTVQSKTGMDKNKEIGEVLSLGYGFIEFTSPLCATYFIRYIDHHAKSQPSIVTLDKHVLSFRLTTPQDNASQLTQETLKMKSILREKGILSYEKAKLQEEWSKNNSKIIVRNIPFEANVREIKEIFKSFAQVKRCTLPRKNGSSQTKGYAFVEFVTPMEAQKAFQSLQHTHIFGRRMVMEWAKPDDTVEDLRVKAQQQLKQ